MGDLIRFVDAIDTEPEVRLDVNDEISWRVVKFDAPPPRLRRASSQNAMSDGLFVSSSQYEARTLSIQFDLITDDQDANAEQFQLLAREIDSGTSLLMYQPTGATSPVFFKLYRSDISEMADIVAQAAYRRFTVELLAEPFALGLREDAIVSQTVPHDPAAVGASPLTVSEPVGDVAAPAVVWIADDMPALTMLVSTQTPTPGFTVQQTETGTLSNDTTVQAHDAAFSGAGSNYVRTTFATVPAIAERMAFSAVLHAGSFRVLMRCRKTVAGNVITARTHVGANYGETVTLPATSAFEMVDLGVIDTAQGIPADLGIGYETGLPVWAWPVAIEIGRTSGAGSLDVDYVLLIPADGTTAVASVSAGAFAASCALDKVNDRITMFSTPGTPFDGNFPFMSVSEYTGSLAMISATTPTYVHFVNLDSAVAISASKVLGVSYWPRYLFVRPATT